MCYLKLFNLFKPIMRAAYLKLSGETWKRGAIWNFWNLKLFKPIMGGLLIWKFQMRLEKEVLFETFETWNFSNMSWGVLYLKLSDETWNEMCYLKLFYLFKPITRVAYFKLSDETWNKICYLKCLKLETFQTCHGGLLIWNFQMRLEVRCAIWNFSKFSNPSQELVIWNFQIRLEVRCVIWNFSTFSNPSWELLIWNFQVRLEKEVLFETFETWNFSNPSWGGCLFETFKWDLKWDVLFETFQAFQTHHESWLFETFRWDLKKRCYLKLLKLETFQTHHGGVAYLKLSDETWKRGAIWNVWNLKLFKHVMGGSLFETFRWD